VVKIHKRNTIDAERWDETVWKESGMPYFYSGFLDAVNPRWQALISDDYEKIFPIPIKTYLGIEVARQPLACQQLGLLGGNTADFFSALKWIKAEIRWVQLTLGLPPKLTFEALEEEAKKQKFKVEKRITYRLDLSTDAFHPWDNISDHHRRHIRKFQSNGCHIAPISSLACIHFFEEHQGKSLKLPLSFYQRFKKIAEMENEPFRVKCWGAFEGVHLRSVMAVLESSGWRIYWLSATDDVGKKLSAAQGLVYHGLSEAFESKSKWDFEGGMKPGLAKFYAGFGAEAREYVYLKAWSL
jgi:hypothetical protein